jgi:hypothetical protein
MTAWSFYDFQVEGRSVIAAALVNLPDVQDKLDSLLLKLRFMELPWPPKFCKLYKLPKKAKERLFEVRIDHLNVEYRFLGCFGPTPRTFTLLAMGTERDFALKAGVIERARGRSRLINNWGNIREHQFND